MSTFLHDGLQHGCETEMAELLLQKRQQIRIHLFLEGCNHAVRRALIDLERGVLISLAESRAESAIGTIWSSSP
jgi:hypothetical protein